VPVVPRVRDERMPGMLDPPETRTSSPFPLARHDLWVVAQRSILLVAAIVFATWLLFTLSSVLTIVLISLILATGLRPLVDELHAHRVPRALAVLLIYLGLVAATVGLGFLIVPSLAAGLSAVVNGAPTAAARLQANLQALEHHNRWLASLLGPLTQHLPDLGSQLGSIAQKALEVAGLALGAASGLLNVLLILILTFYLVTDGPRIQTYLLSFVAPTQRERVRRVTTAMGRRMGGWLRGQFMLSTVVGVLTYVVLLVLGVRGALILAVVAAIAVIIPIIGAVLALLPPVLVALTQSPTLALWTLILLFACQQVELDVLGPLIFQRTVNIHPAAVLLALLVGGTLLGGIGALIAVPVAAAISVGLDEWRYPATAATAGAPAPGPAASDQEELVRAVPSPPTVGAGGPIEVATENASNSGFP
jgi:predicted PurR-regulated permease PerM